MYIYIYIYYFYIYLIEWKLVCDHRFHGVLQTTIIRQVTKDIDEIEKIEKYSQKKVRIVYNSWCVCVCVCACIRLCVCFCVCVSYICALLCVVV